MRFRIENITGSVCLVRPLSSRAAKWLAETAPEDAQYFGRALAVEPRYLDGVVAAIQEAGGKVYS